LPGSVGPWKLSGASPLGGSLPHGIPRKAIEKAIIAQGFQLWRLKAEAAAL